MKLSLLPTLVLGASALLSACGGGGSDCDNKQLVCVTYDSMDVGIKYVRGTGASNPGPLANVGIIQVGQQREPLYLTIKPKHTETVAINSIELIQEAPEPDQFSLDLSNTSFALPAGGSTQFAVRFAPTTAGVKSAVVRVTGSTPGLQVVEYSFEIRGTGAVINGAADYKWEKLVVGGYQAQKAYHIRQHPKEGTCGSTALYTALQHIRTEFGLGDAGYGYGDIKSVMTSLKEDFPDGVTVSTRSLISRYLGTGALSGTNHAALLAGIQNLKSDAGGTTPYFSQVHFRSDAQETFDESVKLATWENEVLPLLRQNLPVIYHVFNHYSVLVGYDEVNELVYWLDTSRGADTPHVHASPLDHFLYGRFVKDARWDSRYYGFEL